MYHLRVVTGENVVVEHHMVHEPVDAEKERELIDGREASCFLL